MEPVRTNNDVEGYRKRINGRAQRDQLQLYLLVHFLDEGDVADEASVREQAKAIPAPDISPATRKALQTLGEVHRT